MEKLLAKEGHSGDGEKGSNLGVSRDRVNGIVRECPVLGSHLKNLLGLIPLKAINYGG